MLRVALAGAGMVSAHHLRAWQRVPDVRVVAIADPQQVAAAARAGEFGIDLVFDDAAGMLDAVRPDALDIAAGHVAHASLCRLAAERGVAILCQKPLAPSLAEARQIVADVGGRARLMVHENWRFRPWYQAARDWIDAGVIGVPREMSLAARSSGLIARHGVLPALARQPMLAAIPRLMIAEVLVHHLDVAGYLMGNLSVLQARVRHDVAAVCGESFAHVVLRGASTTATIEGDFADPHCGPAVTDCMRINGSTGSILLDAAGLRTEGTTPRQLAFDFDAGYQQSYDAAIAHFAQAVAHGTPFATPPGAHLHVLALMEEAYRLASGAADPSVTLTLRG